MKRYREPQSLSAASKYNNYKPYYLVRLNLNEAVKTIMNEGQNSKTIATGEPV